MQVPALRRRWPHRGEGSNEEQAAAAVAAGGTAWFRGIAARGGEINRGKSHVIASSVSLGRRTSAALGQLDISVARTARDLGVDGNVGRAPRRPVFHQRLLAGKAHLKRWARFRGHTQRKLKGIKGQVLAGGGYGLAATGITRTSVLAVRRAVASAAFQRYPAKTCRTAAFLIA